MEPPSSRTLFLPSSITLFQQQQFSTTNSFLFSPEDLKKGVYGYPPSFPRLPSFFLLPIGKENTERRF